MLAGAVFLVIVAGVIRHDWIRHKKAFGVGILLMLIFMGVGLIRTASRSLLGSSGETFVDIVSLAAVIGCVVALLLAFWPGGGLFEIGKGASGGEGPAPDQSKSRQE